MLRNDFAGAYGQVEPIAFDRFVAEVLELYQPPMRAKSTYKKIKYALAFAAEVLGPGATTDMLTPSFVARYIAARPPGESRNTTLSLLSSLRSACTFCMQSGYIRISPFLLRRCCQWIRPEKSRRAQQHISQAEVVKLLAKAKAEIVSKQHHRQASPWAVWRCRRLYALTALLSYTGMRKMEALRMKVVDVNLEAGFLKIVDRDGSRLKTLGSERRLPIAPALAEVLAEWLPYDSSEWLFPNSSGQSYWQGGSPGWRPLDRFKSLGQRAGIADLTFHSMRHSFATHAQAWGWSPGQIARMLGHTRIQTQAHYIHEDLDNLRESVKRITFGPAEDPK